MKFSERVDAAADIISDPDRWTRGQFEDAQGRVCALGALRKAFGGKPNVGSCLSGDYYKAVGFIHKMIRSELKIPYLDHVNDTRGREAAIAVLRDAAARLRKWGF